MSNHERNALLIGVSKFDDPKLGHLLAPLSDVRALESVLKNPEVGKFDTKAVFNPIAYSKFRVSVASPELKVSGEYVASVDPHRRVRVPKPLREFVDQGCVITRGLDGNLLWNKASLPRPQPKPKRSPLPIMAGAVLHYSRDRYNCSVAVSVSRARR